MKKILLSLFIVFSFFQVQSTLANFCTLDAKLCSDGTWVGRTGPNCEFICPGEVKVCTALYLPVCGVDGKTYSNSCFASDVGVKHDGICIGNRLESRFESSWDRVFVNGFSNYTVHDRTFILEKLIEKIDLVETNSEKEYGMYQYIKYMAERSLRNIYELYISNNISQISPVEAVLGGTWYVLSFDWLDKNTVNVDYEDGHIMESIKLKIENIKRKISVKILN